MKINNKGKKNLYLKENIFIIFLLICCFLIYFFYRSNDILINRLLTSIMDNELYSTYQINLQNKLSLPNWMIFNLPEALWTFCLTVTSFPLHLKIKNKLIPIYLFPFVFIVILELLQLGKITHGIFDIWDILLSAIAWIIALGYKFRQVENKHIEHRKNYFITRFAITYLIVYLAHWVY